MGVVACWLPSNAAGWIDELLHPRLFTLLIFVRLRADGGVILHRIHQGEMFRILDSYWKSLLCKLERATHCVVCPPTIRLYPSGYGLINFHLFLKIIFFFFSLLVLLYKHVPDSFLMAIGDWRLVLRIDENTVRPIIIRPPQDTTALIGSEGIQYSSAFYYFFN